MTKQNKHLEFQKIEETIGFKEKDHIHNKSSTIQEPIMSLEKVVIIAFKEFCLCSSHPTKTNGWWVPQYTHLLLSGSEGILIVNLHREAKNEFNGSTARRTPQAWVITTWHNLSSNLEVKYQSSSVLFFFGQVNNQSSSFKRERNS